MLVSREMKCFKDTEKKESQDSHFFLLSYCDRLVINLCQRSDSEKIMLEEFEVIPDKTQCYNNIFPKWSHRGQIMWIAVVCLQRVQQTFYSREKDSKCSRMGVGRGNRLSSVQSN